VSALGALGGLAMMFLVELFGRSDTWMRQRGLGWLLSGSAESDAAMKWLFRLVLGSLAVVFLVAFFAQL
jgi:hypothetical protein